MNEYNDAIQRLEISERPPGTTIKRSIYPIPRKDTPWNYNYVFKNTGNMNIPKYSIPQHLIVVNHNKLCVKQQKEELDEMINTVSDEIDATTDESEIKRLELRLEEYATQLEELENDAKTVFDFPLDQQFTLAQGNRKSIAIRAVNIESCSYKIDDEEIMDDVEFVASSINPWSKNNIISKVDQTFQGMPRMFPWDNQQHITIWFLNSYGRIVESPCIKGSIELELIIDNENTFSYE